MYTRFKSSCQDEQLASVFNTNKNVPFSPSVYSVPIKVGIFNFKILGKNHHHNHQIIHQLKVKELLYHSVQKLFLIVVNPPRDITKVVGVDV